MLENFKVEEEEDWLAAQLANFKVQDDEEEIFSQVYSPTGEKYANSSEERSPTGPLSSSAYFKESEAKLRGVQSRLSQALGKVTESPESFRKRKAEDVEKFVWDSKYELGVDMQRKFRKKMKEDPDWYPGKGREYKEEELMEMVE